MARDLTADEHQLLAQMTTRLGALRERNTRRNAYLDGERRLERVPCSLPSSMRELQVAVGWPRKAVTKFASRMVPRGYTMRTTSSLLDDLQAVADDNSLEYLEAQAIEAAATNGCAFIFTSLGDPEKGEPEVLLTVRDALEATALVDSRTRQVTAAIERPTDGDAVLYLPGRVLTLERPLGGRWKVIDEQETGTGRVLCSPYVHGASLRRPFGVSRITRPLMDLTDMGVRTLLRQEVASEHYAAPRGFLIDVFEDQFEGRRDGGVTGWENIIGAFSALSSQFDEEANQVVEPKIQFAPQMTMQPFSDQFRLIAGAVAGETSIPIHYLGVVQDSNPTSAEAIQAAEVDLVREIKGQFPSFNLGRRSLALDILTAVHGELDAAALADLRGLRPRWEDPVTRSMSEVSQFVQMQVQAGNFQAGTEATLRLLPIDLEDALAIARENRETLGQRTLTQLLEKNQNVPSVVNDLLSSPEGETGGTALLDN